MICNGNSMTGDDIQDWNTLFFQSIAKNKLTVPKGESRCPKY